MDILTMDILTPWFAITFLVLLIHFLKKGSILKDNKWSRKDNPVIFYGIVGFFGFAFLLFALLTLVPYLP